MGSWVIFRESRSPAFGAASAWLLVSVGIVIFYLMGTWPLGWFLSAWLIGLGAGAAIYFDFARCVGRTATAEMRQEILATPAGVPTAVRRILRRSLLRACVPGLLAVAVGLCFMLPINDVPEYEPYDMSLFEALQFGAHVLPAALAVLACVWAGPRFFLWRESSLGLATFAGAVVVVLASIIAPLVIPLLLALAMGPFNELMLLWLAATWLMIIGCLLRAYVLGRRTLAE